MTSSTPTSKITLVPAPQPYTKPTTHPLLFLSGSISLVPSTDPSAPATETTWHEELVSLLTRAGTPTPLTILNPHRADWDASWQETLDFPPFVEQVKWEMDGIEQADIVVTFFGGAAKAPLTLLELGLSTGLMREGTGKGRKKIVICCQEGFWKGGNVRLLAERNGLEVVSSVGELAGRVAELVREWEAERSGGERGE